MADSKISALTAATTPLAGTEVLPIVQSSTTKNISVTNLAAGNLKSTATTGTMQVTGPGAGTNRVKTVNDANDTLLELGGSYTPTGAWNWASATATWPTFNQNTTGTAAGLSSTLATTKGGTGLTSFTNSGIVRASSASALTTSSDFSFNGQTLIINNAANGGEIKVQYNGTSMAFVQLYGPGNEVDFGNQTNGPLVFYTNNTERLNINSNGNCAAGADNSYSWGTSAKRWSVIYAATGTINTSDARTKTQVEDLSEAERRVAIKIKGIVKKFKFVDSVEKKGGAARIHVGVIAQEVAAAFESEGLDAFAYGLFCYDEWQDEYKTIPATEGNTEQQELRTAAGNRYGIRYEELLCFVIASL